ncbi:MAG: glycine/sarcosine/betaine reductase selenoprotein B family protein, partial [Actinomycetota bacterium]
ARRDINVVFPIDALRSLVTEGVVGQLAPDLFTLMGGIYSQRRVNDELAPALVERCRQDDIDAVLLVPV